MTPKKRRPRGPAIPEGQTVTALTNRSCPKCFGMLATASGQGVWCTRLRCDYREPG